MLSVNYHWAKDPVASLNQPIVKYGQNSILSHGDIPKYVLNYGEVMDIITVISIVAALTTIVIALVRLNKKFKKSWEELQNKIADIEQSLHVNQRVAVRYDITVSSNNKVLTIEKDSEVELISVNTETGMVTIRTPDGLLTTKTHIDNIVAQR